MSGWQTAVPDGRAIGTMSKPLERLFDTNCLIDIFRGRDRIRPFFDDILAEEITPYLSVITEAELWRSLRAGELERHNALLGQFIILPLSSEAAQLAGSWMRQYQQLGLGWLDALISATASAADVPLLTRDKKLAQVLQKEVNFQVYG